MVSTTEALVTALLVQTSLYGLYMTTLLICLRWLIFTNEGWKLRRPLDWPMVIATILIFTSYTTWLGANARLVMDYVRGVKVIVNAIYVLGVVTEAGTLVIILVTDAIMIYRCWKVYNKSWLITIFPILCWLGCLISFILVFYYNYGAIFVAKTARQITSAISQSKNAHTALYPCNAATNLYTTCAIIYRIMHDASKRSGYGLKRLQQLCRILAETGFAYTLTTIPPLVAFFLNSKYLIVLQVAEAVNFSMAGIAFNLVLVLVGQSRAAAAASNSRLDYHISSDRQKLLSHNRQLSSLTQAQSITQGDAEKGTIPTTSVAGSGEIN